MKGNDFMLKNMIRLYDAEGDVIAEIRDYEDFDEILPQLDSVQSELLFDSMASAIGCFEGGENVIVNALRFSDIMCEWCECISANEKDTDDDDKEVVFEYFKEEYDVPDNADYYTVQTIVDGFGNDTYVEYSTKSKEKAIEYARKNGYNTGNIIPQYFDTNFNRIDDYDYL